MSGPPGPWGGTNTIARALWKIQHERPDQMNKVSSKAIMYIILDQDKTFREYIQPNWPKLQVLGSFRQFACIAYRWADIIPEPQKHFFEKPWMDEHILTKHGRLCAIYEARDGAFRSEGDSPSFMHQIDVGLRSLEHPGWGGWGGRFVQESPGSNVWRGAKDGGKLTYSWWQYGEVDTYPGNVKIAEAERAKTTVVIPQNAKAGETIHLIAEVTDDGSPPLTRYARVVVSVERE